eukprot:COSAG03_NODE_10321_length_657_cov_2.582437_2_plen_126_part_01
MWRLLPLLLLGRAHAAFNDYVVAASPPGQVDGSKIHFDEVVPTGATIQWEQPDLGTWKLPVHGYRIRYSADRDFPKVLTPTHAPIATNAAMDPSRCVTHGERERGAAPSTRTRGRRRADRSSAVGD